MFDWKKKKGHKGNLMAVGPAIISIVVGFGVAVVIGIFMNVLGGQAYSQSQDQINAVTNETIRTMINSGMAKGFTAQKTLWDYMPLVALGVAVAIVLYVVLSAVAGHTGMHGGGSL